MKLFASINEPQRTSFEVTLIDDYFTTLPDTVFTQRRVVIVAYLLSLRSLEDLDETIEVQDVTLSRS